MVVVSTNKENDMNESTLVPREEISDLDWLARNVHEWPAGEHQPWCYVYMTYGGAMKAAGNFLDAVANPTMITKDQWLARRSELQNKPSWAEVPAEAKYMTQGSGGAWGCWSDKPAPVKEKNESGDTVEYWGGNNPLSSFNVENKMIGEVLGDWRDTLEKRPEQTIADICREVTGENRHEEIFEPFVSVEDAKITIMQGDGDVKRFGGIIGRSLPLEEDAATAKQPAPKGSGNPILGMVLADLTNRALEGKEKYGEPLLAHNGRNPLWDAYQEALDLAMYLRQAIEEQKQ